MNQTLAVFATVVLFTGIAPPVSAQSTPYVPDSMTPQRIVLRGGVDVPLLRPSARDSRAQVDVMINGRGPYRFDLETGARQIGISRALADSLGLRRTGGPPDAPEFHIDSINIGGGVFEGITAASLPPEVRGVDGVLGLPFYQNALLTIDYPGSRVRITDDTLPAANGQDILPLARISDFWGIPVTIAGARFLAVLDTQNSGAIGIPPSIADSLPFDGGLQTVGRARGTFGVIDIKGGLLAGDIVLGRYTLVRPFIDVVPLPPEFPRKPNIGTRVLDNFVVSLDQRHGRMRLAHAGSPAIKLPGPTRRAAP